MANRQAQTSNVALRQVRPNAGNREQYARKLQALVRAMATDVAKTIKDVYRKNEPLIASDAKAKTPAQRLQEAIKELRKVWIGKIDKQAESLALWFLDKTSASVDRAQNSAARDSGFDGFDIKFYKGSVNDDVFQALVNENVNLIKSIPQKYLTDVEGLVMRSITAGRDVSQLQDDLSERYAITKRRAEFIARDQNQKATEALSRANAVQAGATEGVWIHVPGKYTSRKSHEKMHGKKFDLNKGMWDEAEQKWVLPGQLAGCACTYRPLFTRALWKKKS